MILDFFTRECWDELVSSRELQGLSVEGFRLFGLEAGGGKASALSPHPMVTDWISQGHAREEGTVERTSAKVRDSHPTNRRCGVSYP